ncbi:PhnD/SsuA/transferrin family substrate-binding protein, partial [candidate division KSB1 bacterium]|nr:PhnD/SsuA/transferrin family substrate-binding protein [candidate division KSB1 bacterium]
MVTNDEMYLRRLVVIQRSDGTVDFYFDSAFPTLAVQELSGSQVIARRWKHGEPTYWSTIITLRDNGITTVGDHNLIMAYAHIAHDCI